MTNELKGRTIDAFAPKNRQCYACSINGNISRSEITFQSHHDVRRVSNSYKQPQWYTNLTLPHISVHSPGQAPIDPITRLRRYTHHHEALSKKSALQPRPGSCITVST
ncbi:Polyadenylate-binding protein-interacting protein 7 [Fusarium oxysporum f. sp. albedinis]|nr:Polyadenylate-binding protein-interacting protein 7 [Fusarium oxysporum f. sp. albedinis]